MLSLLQYTDDWLSGGLFNYESLDWIPGGCDVEW